MLFHLEINFGWSEEICLNLAGDIAMQRIKQLEKYRKDNPNICPLMSRKR